MIKKWYRKRKVPKLWHFSPRTGTYLQIQQCWRKPLVRWRSRESNRSARSSSLWIAREASSAIQWDSNLQSLLWRCKSMMSLRSYYNGCRQTRRDLIAKYMIITPFRFSPMAPTKRCLWRNSNQALSIWMISPLLILNKTHQYWWKLLKKLKKRKNNSRKLRRRTRNSKKRSPITGYRSKIWRITCFRMNR